MPGSTVTVRLSGTLAQLLGNRRTVHLPEGATVESLVVQVAALAGLPQAEARGLAVVAGGQFLQRDEPLTDGQQVDVLVPVAGG